MKKKIFLLSLLFFLIINFYSPYFGSKWDEAYANITLEDSHYEYFDDFDQLDNDFWEFNNNHWKIDKNRLKSIHTQEGNKIIIFSEDFANYGSIEVSVDILSDSDYNRGGIYFTDSKTEYSIELECGSNGSDNHLYIYKDNKLLKKSNRITNLNKNQDYKMVVEFSKQSNDKIKADINIIFIKNSQSRYREKISLDITEIKSLGLISRYNNISFFDNFYIRYNNKKDDGTGNGDEEDLEYTIIVTDPSETTIQTNEEGNYIIHYGDDLNISAAINNTSENIYDPLIVIEIENSKYFKSSFPEPVVLKNGVPIDYKANYIYESENNGKYTIIIEPILEDRKLGLAEYQFAIKTNVITKDISGLLDYLGSKGDEKSKKLYDELRDDIWKLPYVIDGIKEVLDKENSIINSNIMIMWNKEIKNVEGDVERDYTTAKKFINLELHQKPRLPKYF